MSFVAFAELQHAIAVFIFDDFLQLLLSECEL